LEAVFRFDFDLYSDDSLVKFNPPDVIPECGGSIFSFSEDDLEVLFEDSPGSQLEGYSSSL